MSLVDQSFVEVDGVAHRDELSDHLDGVIDGSPPVEGVPALAVFLAITYKRDLAKAIVTGSSIASKRGFW